jgi:hypothetical protein
VGWLQDGPCAEEVERGYKSPRIPDWLAGDMIGWQYAGGLVGHSYDPC